MKRIPVYLMVCIFICVGFSACSDDAQNVEIPVEEYNIHDYGYYWNTSMLNLKEIYVINSQPVLESYILSNSEAAERPVIDFDKYTLLMVYLNTPTTGGALPIRLIKTDHKDYLLYVRYDEENRPLIPMPQKTVAAVLVPKMEKPKIGLIYNQ